MENNTLKSDAFGAESEAFQHAFTGLQETFLQYVERPNDQMDEPFIRTRGGASEQWSRRQFAQALRAMEPVAIRRMVGLMVTAAEMLRRDKDFPTPIASPAAVVVGGAEELQAKYEAALKVLRGYEKWEADIISSDDAWNTRSGHPWMTDEIYDEMMDLQHDRNAALAASPAVVVGGGEGHKLDAYRALVDSVVTSNSAPDGVKAWLKGVSEKIEADENECEACEGTGREDVIGEWSCKWCDGTGKGKGHA